jgi:hypothetical protein
MIHPPSHRAPAAALALLLVAVAIHPTTPRAARPPWAGLTGQP